MERAKPTTNGAAPEMSQEEGRAMIDRQAHRYLDMSGEEFIRRWDAGAFGDPDDRFENHPAVMRLGMLVPFVR
jgi:hypothetical protein